MPYNSSFFGAHFYAPAKNLFGRFIDTFYANLLVLWGMTILLAICLFFDIFPKTMRFLDKLLNPNRVHRQADSSQLLTMGKYKA
jgi:hypothetical protein